MIEAARSRSFSGVGPLSFGAAAIGNLGRAVDDETAMAAVDAAWDVGVRYFDVAPFYGLGLAERRLGRALARRPRDEYVLSTKVGRRLRDTGVAHRDDRGFDVVTSWERFDDYSRDGAMRSLEESLERLGMDRVDVVLVHDPEEHLSKALDGAFRALDDLRAAGVVRAYGAGANTVEALWRVLECTDADVLLAARTLTAANPVGLPLASAALASHRTVIAAGVFTAPAGPANRRREIRRICREVGVDEAAVLLQYPLRCAGAATVLVGMRSPQEVAENAELMGTVVHPDVWTALRDFTTGTRPASRERASERR